MKQIYYALGIIFALCMSADMSAQSISASKIISYLNGQNISDISSDLLKLGFISGEKKKTSIFSGYAYSKNSEYGTEKLNIAINDELFSIIYSPATQSMYSAIKEKMLTKDFKYSYSHQVTKYYENTTMRIGVNDSSKIISFFVKKM